jgi:hypothetical protein
MKSHPVAPDFRLPARVRATWRGGCIGIALLALLPLAATAQTITSAVPGLLSYQGRITNASGALVGAGTPVNRTVILRVWSHQTNSTAADLVYSEQQTVTISEGEFSVLIGAGSAVSGTPLGYSEATKGPPSTTIGAAAVFGGANRFLGVTIDDGSANADPEVSPRQQMVTSAYAFRARYAESVGANGANTITALDNGNVGVGTANPGARLDVNGTLNVFDSGAKSYPGGIATEVGSQLINYGINDGRFGTAATSQAGGFLRVDARGTTFGGDLFQFSARPAGSANASQVVGISATGHVGIGQPLAGFPLTFASTVGDKISLYGNSGAHYGFGVQANLLQIHSDTVGTDIAFGYGSSGSFNETMRVKGNGNVGIGTSAPTAKLHVQGAITSTSLNTGALNLTGPMQASGSATTHTQGAYLEWNKDGSTGMTYLLNQRGTGSGGIVLGDVDTANTVTERIRIDSNGNVGIGTNPGRRFHVNGPSMRVANGADGIEFLQTSTTAWQFSPVGAATAIGLLANIGVGTTTPATTLDVRGASPFITVGTTGGTNGGLYLGNGGHGLVRSYPSTAAGNNDVGLYTTAGDVYISGNGQATSHLVVKNNGRVGIGTNNPIAPLQVSGGAALGAFFLGAKVWPDTTGDDNNSAFNASSAAWGGTTHSIVSDLRIRASALDVTNINNSSDARIKRVTGRSSGPTDLTTLAAIEIADYTYIDRMTHGAAPQKKVVAQQIEAVFPQAVRKTTDVIPDIFQRAAIRDGWVALATTLKVGERVRLIGATESGIHEVLEVDATRFRTAFKPAGDEQVFVYGREVADFRTVDYTALSMLNVSATQELKRQHDAELATLRTANAELAARVAELESRDRARDAKLASIEKLLAAGQTVMARPASSATTSNASGQE